MVPSSRICRALGAALALGLGATSAAGGTVTGVCPDGSIFIVKQEADIPCRDARRVDPQEVPPIKPEFLPRPYAWDRFHHQQDPNNPYNLVEQARRLREAERAGTLPPRVDAAPPGPAPQAATSPPGVTPARQTASLRPSPAPSPRLDLDLSPQEIRDLFLIVELAQQRAPAHFVPNADRAVHLRVAPSSAFASRLREARAQRGADGPAGPVLLFSAVAERQGAFWGHLTFVQGRTAFQPDPEDPDQFGVLHGRLGVLSPPERLLGYVLLPPGMDPEQPLDIYWNDRLLTATLRP